MSVRASTWVWEHSQAQGNALLVLLAIADAANSEGEESCQGVARLARMSRCSESTVRRAIRALREAGEVEHTGQSERYGGTNIYRIPGVTGGGVNLTGGVISTGEGVSPVTPEPTTYPTTNSVQRTEVAVEQAVEPERHPSRPIASTWQPRLEFRHYLAARYPHADLDGSIRRFALHYFAAQATSKSWEARLEVWVNNDNREAESRLLSGTDSMGIPHSQRKTSVVPPPAQPGDPDYFDPTEWFRSETEKEQP